MAIQPAITALLGKLPEKSLKLVNVKADRYHSFETPLTEDICINDDGQPHWWNYFLCGLKGVMEQLKLETWPSEGLACLIDGNIPPASGLSSSSALVITGALATLSIVQKLDDKAFDRFALAALCAESEKYIGTQGGGMDQAIELLAQPGCAQSIEFNPLRNQNVPLPQGATFVIANSLAESNKAAGSEFNHRVVECRLASVLLAKSLNLTQWAELKRLKDLQTTADKSLPDMIELVQQYLHTKPYSKPELSELLEMSVEHLEKLYLTKNTKDLTEFKLNQRANHVFSEAFRVAEYQRICCQSGQEEKEASSTTLAALGQLMFESHWSCANNYQCSHPKLDQLVELSKQGGALGARLTGAGWGGCIVALVHESKTDQYINFLQANYYQNLPDAKGQLSSTYLFCTEPGPGASVFTV